MIRWCSAGPDSSNSTVIRRGTGREGPGPTNTPLVPALTFPGFEVQKSGFRSQGQKSRFRYYGSGVTARARGGSLAAEAQSRSRILFALREFLAGREGFVQGDGNEMGGCAGGGACHQVHVGADDRSHHGVAAA